MTNEQYIILKNWISQQDTQDATELYELLLMPSIKVRQIVPRWKVKEYLYSNGIWPSLVASEDPLAITALAYLNDPDFENLDLDNVAVKALLDGLATLGIITDTAPIDALADTFTTPAISLGLNGVRLGNIQSVLAS